MIYTSYFARASKVPEAEIISIARFTPKWLPNVACELDLAPSIELLNSIKEGLIDDIEYTVSYLIQLNDLGIENIINWLKSIDSEDKLILLCCYEKPGEFCHRNILKEKLKDYGYEIKEYGE